MEEWQHFKTFFVHLSSHMLLYGYSEVYWLALSNNESCPSIHQNPRLLLPKKKSVSILNKSFSKAIVYIF